ncbi:hypothetical protein JOM56_000694 [Amanita muscaria]
MGDAWFKPPGEKSAAGVCLRVELGYSLVRIPISHHLKPLYVVSIPSLPSNYALPPSILHLLLSSIGNTKFTNSPSISASVAGSEANLNEKLQGLGTILGSKVSDEEGGSRLLFGCENAQLWYIGLALIVPKLPRDQWSVVRRVDSVEKNWALLLSSWLNRMRIRDDLWCKDRSTNRRFTTLFLAKKPAGSSPVSLQRVHIAYATNLEHGVPTEWGSYIQSNLATTNPIFGITGTDALKKCCLSLALLAARPLQENETGNTTCYEGVEAVFNTHKCVTLYATSICSPIVHPRLPLAAVASLANALSNIRCICRMIVVGTVVRADENDNAWGAPGNDVPDIIKS